MACEGKRKRRDTYRWRKEGKKGREKMVLEGTKKMGAKGYEGRRKNKDGLR